MPLPPGLRNPRHVAASSVLAFVALSPSPAAAADLPGARLDVSRDASAEACPDSEQLSAELAKRMSPAAAAPAAPLLLTVSLERDAEEYVANIRVEGRRHGERTLRAAGPTCDALHDALIVTLLVLLDEDRAPGAETTSTGEPAGAGMGPEAAAPASSATPATPSPSPEALNVPALPVAAPRSANPALRSERRRSEPLTLWLSLGGAVTHGVALDWSGALLFDLSVRLGAWELSAGGFWGPSHDVATPPGHVTVGAFGERLRSCYAVQPLRRSELRVLGCATAALAQLSGTGVDLVNEQPVTRPWWLAGAAAEATLPLTARIDAGLAVAALATLKHEAFSVEGAANSRAYETDSFVAVFSARIEARLF